MNRCLTKLLLLAMTIWVGADVWPGVKVGANDGSNDRPNIVLILSDDQAWTDYGFMGHPHVETPHLDALAERSLVLQRGYVASPLCRPSLASIVTGLYPFQHGITGNDVNGRTDRAALDEPLRERFHRHPSWIRALVSEGYLAHQSGKWWEGSFADGGFTHGMTHGNPKRGGRHGDEGLKIGREGMSPVIEFIEMAIERKKPFIVWYAPFLPHTPHNPPQRLVDKYARHQIATDVSQYYATCEWFDETCGELLDHIDRRGISGKTIVIYICDNGWAAASTNADDPNQSLWKGFAQRSKGSPYEMGIRTPIMVSWPGHLAPERSHDLAHAIDLYPTIAAATGLEVPSHLEGINLADAPVRGKRQRVFGVTHSIFNMTVGDPDDTQQYLWCVQGDWKLLVRYPGKDTTRYRNVHVWDKAPVRLFNLRNDPHEKRDLAGERPDIVERMRRTIEAWH